MMQHMNLWQKARQVWLVVRFELMPALRGQTVEQAAATQTWAALAPTDQLVSGSYLNGNLGHELGKPDTPTALAQDDAHAKRVYDFASSFFKLDASAAS